jgi:hypothetical protein
MERKPIRRNIKMTCICIDENRLWRIREQGPKLGEVFMYQLMDTSQFNYRIYDLKTGDFLWQLTDRSFYKIFKDLQEHREQQLEEILK